jgi:hypothetical protein
MMYDTAICEDQYYLLIEGETSGPFSLEQLQQLWLSKGIPLDTLYAAPGLKECQPVDTLLSKIIAYHKPEVAPPPAPPAPDPYAAAKWVATYSLIVTLVGGAIWSISPFSRRARPLNVVEAAVEVTPIRVSLTNNDGQDWSEKTIILNDGPDGGYRYRIGSLRAGQTVHFSLIEFISPAGKRFQPWNMSVLEVWIGGGGKDFKRYRITPK